METIKTSTETIIAAGNDTWEDLGSTPIFQERGRTYHSVGMGKVFYKFIPGLGARFKVLFKDILYSPIHIDTGGRSYNAKFNVLTEDYFVNIDGF